MAPRLIADNIRELLPMQRSPGNHVSEIINRLCVKLGKWESGERPTGIQIQFETGNSVEDMIADYLARRYAKDQPSRYIHGFEANRDGISGNIDLFDTFDMVVEDVKLTKKSLRNIATKIEGEEFEHNWWQVMTYTYMLEMSNTGRLHVVFVNGNYSHDREDPLSGWQYRCWEDTWTDKQLADVWRMVYGHRIR